MPIHLIGPDWPSVSALRADLAAVPTNGSFRFGYAKVPSTEQLAAFRAADLRVPEFTTDSAEAIAWVESGSVVFGRRQSHSQGRDIIPMVKSILHAPTRELTRLRRRWNHRQWFSRVVDNVFSEWRIHIFDTKAIARGMKIPNPAIPPENTGYGAIRSRSRGWLMRHDIDPPRGIRRAARAAIASLERRYGAVDILHVPDGFVILEANAMPAMDTYTRTAYVRAITRACEG